MQKLFEIQRKLFANVVELACGCLEKTPNASDPSQYVVLKTLPKEKALEIVFCTMRLAIVVRLESSDDFLKILEEGVYTVKGDILCNLLCKIDVMAMATVSHDKEGLVFSFPNQVNGKEEWTVPCVDAATLNLSTSPKIEMGKEFRFKTKTEKFLKWLGKVSMAVGKDSGNPVYRNVLVRAKNGNLDFVTSSIGQLAWAHGDYQEATTEFKNFLFITPHEQLMDLAKLLDKDEDIVVIHNPGEPGTVVLAQDIQYVEKVVGQVFLRTYCSTEPFVQFESTIKSLKAKLKNVCTVKTQQFVNVVGRLALLEPPETKVVWDKEKNSLVFSKQETGRGAAKGLALPIQIVEGKDQFEIFLSSRHLKMIADEADEKVAEITWMFGEPDQFTCIKFSEEIETYFTPMKEMP